MQGIAAKRSASPAAGSDRSGVRAPFDRGGKSRGIVSGEPVPARAPNCGTRETPSLH
jgi:hypothetical protein